MADEDSASSTEFSDVFLRGMATPFFRPLVVWMISVVGVLACLLWHALSVPLSVPEGVDEDDFWLTVLGPPLSFIGSVEQGLYSNLWVNTEEGAYQRGWYEPWQYSKARAYTLRVLLPLAPLLWVGAAFRVCAGRRVHSSLCHLFFASFLITSGRLEHRWWLGVGLSAAMVWMYWHLEFFRRIRVGEQEFERDGI